jgi:predicted nucleotidyltransferase
MKLEYFERLSKEGTSRGLVMALVKTLAERKRAQVEAIHAGIARLREDLTEYGRTHGGKFVLYGSAVSGRIHYDSDVDIIVDFEEDDLASAIDFVETTCRRLKLRADVQPKSWCKEAFLRKIAPNTLVIP